MSCKKLIAFHLGTLRGSFTLLDKLRHGAHSLHNLYGWLTMQPCHSKKLGCVAAIAPWFRLRLPSCGPGFESQAHHPCFFQFVLKL